MPSFFYPGVLLVYLIWIGDLGVQTPGSFRDQMGDGERIRQKLLKLHRPRIHGSLGSLEITWPWSIRNKHVPSPSIKAPKVSETMTSSAPEFAPLPCPYVGAVLNACMLLRTDLPFFWAYCLLRPETRSGQEEPMMSTTTWQTYRVLGLGMANLELLFSIPGTLWAQQQQVV